MVLRTKALQKFTEIQWNSLDLIIRKSSNKYSWKYKHSIKSTWKHPRRKAFLPKLKTYESFLWKKFSEILRKRFSPGVRLNNGLDNTNWMTKCQEVATWKVASWFQWGLWYLLSLLNMWFTSDECSKRCR